MLTLIEIGAMWVVLSRTPEKRMNGHSELMLDTALPENVLRIDAVGSTKADFAPGGDLETALARDFASVGEVDHLLVERADGNFLVWIVLDNPIREVRERIFQKELSLIEGFPEVEFDFNIIRSSGQAPEDIATGARVIYSRNG